MAFLQGLYPDSTGVSIFVADKSLDPWRKSSSICPRLKDRIKSVRDSSTFTSTFSQNRSVLGQISLQIGIDVSSLPEIVMATRCDGRTFDNATEPLLDVSAYLKGAEQAFVYAHESVFPLAFSFSAADMLNAMIARINGASAIRFIHWSAHDGNLLAFLGYLGAGLNILPPYGSFIATELLSSRADGRLVVRFIFNGKVMSLPRFGNVSLLPFGDLVAFVRGNMPDVQAACGFQWSKWARGSVFSGA
jgi:acid phosphatase